MKLLLSPRAYNRLRLAGLGKLDDAAEFIRSEPERLRKIRNLGTKTAMEIMEKLKPYLEIDSEEEFQIMLSRVFGKQG